MKIKPQNQIAAWLARVRGFAFGIPRLAVSMQFEHRGPPHPGPLPKEREPSLTDFRNSLDGDLACGCQMFSLSLRERAGVRGKGAHRAPNRLKAGLQTQIRRGGRASVR